MGITFSSPTRENVIRVTLIPPFHAFPPFLVGIKNKYRFLQVNCECQFCFLSLKAFLYFILINNFDFIYPFFFFHLPFDFSSLTILYLQFQLAFVLLHTSVAKKKLQVCFFSLTNVTNRSSFSYTSLLLLSMHLYSLTKNSEACTHKFFVINSVR